MESNNPVKILTLERSIIPAGAQVGLDFMTERINGHE
jgi:hypothetical protein